MKLRKLKLTEKEIKFLLIGGWALISLMGFILCYLGLSGLASVGEYVPDVFAGYQERIDAASLLPFPLNETAVLREEMYNLNFAWMVIFIFIVHFIMIIFGAVYGLSSALNSYFAWKGRLVHQRLDKLEKEKGWRP